MQRLEAQQIQGEDERVGSSALLGATAAYGILGAVALVAFGRLPAASDTGAQVVTWFREHSGVCGRSRSPRRHSHS